MFDNKDNLLSELLQKNVCGVHLWVRKKTGLVCYYVKMNDINYKIIEIFCCITFLTRNLLY